MKTNQSNQNANPRLLAACQVVPSQSTVLLPQLIAAYQHTKITSSPHYVRVLRRTLQKLARGTGAIPIGNLTTAQIRAIVLDPQLRLSGRRRYLFIIQNLLRWCRNHGYLPKGRPTAADAIHLDKPVRATRIVTATELKALFAGANDVEMCLVLALVAFAGLRRGELEQLSWEDIQPGNSVAPNATSISYRRLVQMFPVLDAWLRPFYGSRGRVVSGNSHRRITRLAIKLNIPWSGNIFRRSFAAHASVLSGNPKTAAQQLGVPFEHWHLMFPGSVSLPAAGEYFGLTPEAVGILTWPELVAAYLHERTDRLAEESKSASGKSTASKNRARVPKKSK